jgi:uncharacterized membrane protein
MTVPSAEAKPVSRGRFRRHFYTGLLVLAPVWLTVYIIIFVVSFIGGILSPYVRALAISMLGHGPWERPVNIISDIVAFVVTVGLIALIGFAVRKVVGQRLVGLVGHLLGHIPVIREIYNGVRKFLDVIFGDKKFRQVVAVRFPTDRTWSIGFVTSELQINIPHDSTTAHITVFVPKTPNPTNGFLLLCQPQDVVPLSLSVDEAVKLIVSGGTLIPERLTATAKKSAEETPGP